MAWPPTTHQDAVDEIETLRNGKGWATSLGARQRVSEATKAAPLLWVAGRWYQGQVVAGMSTLAPPASELRLFPLYIPTARQIDRISCNVSTAGTSGHVARMGLYNADPTSSFPTTVLVDSGTVGVGTTGIKEVIVSAPMHGMYWLGLTSQSGTFTALSSLVGATSGGATTITVSAATTLIYGSVDPTVALADRTSVAPTFGALAAPVVGVRAV